MAMKMRLRICCKCSNVRITEFDDENSVLICPVCNESTEHYFTDCCFSQISQKLVQALIDYELKT